MPLGAILGADYSRSSDQYWGAARSGRHDGCSVRELFVADRIFLFQQKLPIGGEVSILIKGIGLARNAVQFRLKAVKISAA